MDDEQKKEISQLQEIFHMTSTEAENSYLFYKCNLSDAINGLASQMDQPLEQVIERSPIAGNESNNNAVVATCSPNPNLSTSDDATPMGTTNNPIDLTQDDDLQKALALSLQDMQHQNGGISFEDQELSRALEASIAETHTDKDGHVKFFIDPTNPHERKRMENEPVGLKNIGNTCWFSSVIQSLFYIPMFRQLILLFKPLDTTEQQLPHCVLFVIELQKLFALLLRSNQRYINPKSAIDLLQSVFNQSTVSSAQQDVSEFTHKLLEWIEDAFQFSLEKDQSNPMLDLFTGQCVTEGILNDLPFVNNSQFGAFPVQIEGHAHLHDSLEAATVNIEMSQETWFTRLPQVLVIELSRFKFNQTTGQAEKLHDQLHFDRTLYMDRYMHSNCLRTRQCREEIGKLKAKIKKLQKSLEMYTNYCGKNMAVNDMLSLALDFVCRGEDKFSSAANVPTKESEEGIPRPKSGTHTDIIYVKNHLHQWIKEMDAEISGLKASLTATQDTLKSVYADPSMNKVGYNLHAVLVHQGQASRGHYWAYVRKGTDSKQFHSNEVLTKSPLNESEVTANDDNEDENGEMEIELIDTQSTRDQISSTDHQSFASKDDISESIDSSRWLKFNDVSVTEVDWEEVQKESYGQTSANTSAYCLVYINSDIAEQLEDKSVLGQMLPPSLERYVIESNMLFGKEIESYDLMKQLKDLQEKTPSGKELIKPAKCVRFETSTATVNGEVNHDMQAIASDAKRARAESPSVLEDMQIDTENIPPLDPLLTTQLQAKIEQKLQSLSKEMPRAIIEPRLLSLFHYATICQSSSNVRDCILLFEVYHESEKDDNLPLSYLGRKEYLSLCRKSAVRDELKLVRELYHLFCCTCYHLIQSINEIKKDNWCLALTHSIQCFELNCQILQRSNERYALNQQILRHFRSKTLLEVSQLGTSSFTSGEVGTSLLIGNEYIVPTLKAFSQSVLDSKEESVLERVREEWCQCLDQSSLTEDDSDKLADLLVKIVDDYTKAPNIKLPQVPKEFDSQRLAAQFTNAYNMLTTKLLPVEQ